MREIYSFNNMYMKMDKCKLNIQLKNLEEEQKNHF